VKLSLLAALTVALISCTQSQPLGNSEQLPGAMAAAPNCTFALQGKTSNVTNTQLAACAVLICSLNPAGCVNTPNPIPPTPPVGTGGALSTGGRASAGGNAATGGLKGTGGTSAAPGNLANCIAALTKDPGVANVAAQQGITAKSLATKECADPSVLARHP
jgi:hypothetical protein